MNFLLFFANNFLIFYICRVFSCLIFKKDKSGQKLIACLGLIPVLILFILLTLSALKSINSTNIFILLFVISSILFYFASKQKQSLNIFKNNLTQDLFNSNSRAVHILFGIFFSCLILYTAKTCLLGTCFIFDDFSYHAASCAHWIKDGYFSIKPFNYHAYYPFNSELISLWLMIPFKNDCEVYLAGFFWIALLITLCALFVFPQKNGKIKMFAVMSLIILSNVIYENGKSFSAVDLACPAMVLCALYMIGKKINNLSDYAFSGLFLGFAIGSKISFLPVALVFFIFILADKSNPANKKTKNFILFISCMAVTGSLWYLRNLILTGNPLYPAEFMFFKGAMTSDYLNKTKLIHWLTSSNLNMHDYLAIIKHHLNWPYSLGILSVLGYLSYPFVKKKNKLFNLLFLSGLIFLVFYPFTPFSGTINKINAPLRLENRFIILPFINGIILFSSLIPKHFITLLIFTAIIVADKKILLGSNLKLTLCFIATITITFYFFRKKLVVIFDTLLNFRWIMCGLFLLFVLFLIPHNKKLTSETIKNYGHANQPIGKGWIKINTLPDNSKITWFGESTYQYYPLFGRSLHLNPCDVDEYGNQNLPLHKQDTKKLKQTTNLIANLNRQKTDYVFFSKKTDKNWPAQYNVLLKSNEIKEIYNDGCSAILKLNNK